MSNPAPSTSAVPYGSISSTSVLNLKAQLFEQQDQFNKTRHLGKTITGVKRTKPSIFKRNKGVNSRADRDEVQYEDDIISSSRDPAKLKASLERKAKIYDKIRRGKTGGLDSNQIDNLLVDFDRKRDDYSSEDSSEEEDESATVPQRLLDEEADPLVDFTDEFGRTRQIRRSEMPRGQAVHHVEPQDESNVIYGDQSSFPVYAPDPSLLAARAAAYAASAPLVSHYDASGENRSKAAGFYQFSKDEATRREQMDALKRDRLETEVQQEKAAAGVVSERDRKKEARKRKIEEKRKQIELKRKASSS